MDRCTWCLGPLHGILPECSLNCQRMRRYFDAFAALPVEHPYPATYAAEARRLEQLADFTQGDKEAPAGLPAEIAIAAHAHLSSKVPAALRG
jgi:hypothetical protein